MCTIVLSFHQSYSVAVQPTKHATDECTKLDANVGFKRGSDLCSQQGSNVDRLQAQLLLLVLPNVASSQLLVVRVSDGSADL